ncbi:MAG: NADH:ubiquinone reductase (Na(+)-transporting) subunit F [Gammaproteobacteria bacterium]|nr:NADH:ubiquinone reductase (Na(+)-transporting) subunit F [Gammaproteobacteria bacterium]
MLEISLGVTLFTAIVMLLALVILAARSKLVPTGDIRITINEGKVFSIPVGGKLLGALADAEIHLPSACAGVGTCGLCRVEILEGGGTILPAETSLITKRDAARGTRLACQVAVKQDMRIRLPDEIFGAKEWQCRVRSNRSVATLIKELVLELLPDEIMKFRAGAFIQVICPPYRKKFSDFDVDPQFRDLWDNLDLWRYESHSTTDTTRAYSLANYPGEQGIVILNVRIAIPPPGAPDSIPPGVVSSYLFGLKPGDKISISGPYGNFFASETEREMIFIGGGVGMAPMRSHIFDQLKRLKTKRTITFWYGARNRHELFYATEFDRLQHEHENFKWHVALSEPKPEDSWQGFTGFIHEVVYENHLKNHPAPEDCEYYLCGPPMMIKALLTMLDGLGVERDSILFDDFSG